MSKALNPDKAKTSLKDEIEEDLISKLKENLQECFYSYQKQDQMTQSYNKSTSQKDDEKMSEYEKRNKKRERMLMQGLKKRLI